MHFKIQTGAIYHLLYAKLVYMIRWHMVEQTSAFVHATGSGTSDIVHATLVTTEFFDQQTVVCSCVDAYAGRNFFFDFPMSATGR